MPGDQLRLCICCNKKYAAPIRQSHSISILHFWENGTLLWGAFRPNPGQCAAFPQLCIFNASESLHTRRETFHGVLKDSVILDVLTTVEDIENPYISAYRTMYNIEQQEIRQARVENLAVAEIRMYMRSGPDRRRYSQPTTDEVAAIYVGDDGSPPLHDFSVFSNDGKVRAVPITSPHCDPFGHLG